MDSEISQQTEPAIPEKPVQASPLIPPPSRQKFLLLGLGFIILILGIGAYFAFTNKSQSTYKNPIKYSKSPFPTLAPTATPVPLPIAKLIQFKLPTGWSQKDYPNIPSILISSPEMGPGAAGGPAGPVIGISIEAHANTKQETIDSMYQRIYAIVHDPNPGGAVYENLTKTTIGGYPAISYTYNFEGYQHTYELVVGDTAWKIVVGASNPEDETKYQSTISSVLASITFLTIGTGNWKTYTDAKQMYTIKYPSTWYIFPNIIGGIIPGYDGTIINSASTLEPHGETLAENGQAGIAINVSGIDKTEDESLLEYINKNFSSPDTKNPSYLTVVINGNSGLKYVRTANEPDAGQPIYYFSNKNNVYTINVSIQNSKYESVVNQILQTFTFTK